MSSKKSNQTQVPNGTGSSEVKNPSLSDPDGAFRKLFDAAAACSKHKSFYLKAEATGEDLNKARAQLTEKTKQYNEKEISYNDLLQVTIDDRQRFGREKEDLKAEHQALRKELEICKANLGQQKDLQADLQKQVEDHKRARGDISDALKHEKALSAGLDKDLEAKEKDCESLNAALRDTSGNLQKWQAYKSNLVPVDFPSFREMTERLWRDAVSFAQKYFHADVSTTVLDRQADWIKEAKRLYKVMNLPSFPASNSAAAKSMRMAVALAVLTSLISNQIFLTTYIKGGAMGLHDLLTDQAWADDKTASLCRALLLSCSSPEDQNKYIEKAVRAVEDDFYTFAVRLLVPDQYGEYTTDLKSLIRQATDLWQGAQRSTVLLDAGLDLARSRLWTAFGSSTPATPLDPEDDQGIELPEEDVVLVVFPGFIRSSTKSEETVFPSMVLGKSQMVTIEEELKTERNEAAARARTRPVGRRRDSNTGNRAPFLGTSS
ncbi:hypothetical protein BDV97DRAFT_413292 [Delphinella strobiligena]|nr:hypothetical protein BDV97DRAFT_413292 [Delphinella strobiligena]